MARDPLAEYLREVNKMPLLDEAQQTQLSRQITGGGKDVEAAKKRLLEANLRLVVAVARRYKEPGVPLIDLIQEGNIGLMRAVERFDPAGGVLFSTFATGWIREAIDAALEGPSAGADEP